MINPIDGPGEYRRRDGSVTTLTWDEDSGYYHSYDNFIYSNNTDAPYTGHLLLAAIASKNALDIVEKLS